MVECWVAAAIMVQALSESQARQKALSKAETPEEKAALMAVFQKEDDHRRALQVARASAPRVTVVNRIFY